LQAFERAQPGIGAGDVAAAFSIEWQLAAAPHEALQALRAIDPSLLGMGIVAGVGHSLLRALGGAIPGFGEIASYPGMPSTPHALWTLVPGSTSGQAFERADALSEQLGGSFVGVQCAALFRFRDGRDLTGYRDGAANPSGADAARAALIGAGPRVGGSFALVQRYRHDRRAFAALAVRARDAVIGRTLEGDLEIDTAPASSHVKRSAQETFEPAAFVLRRSMPWGDPLCHGLQYIAFGADTDRFDRILRRMTGLEDGTSDALLRFSHAETSAYYFCPAAPDGRLDLP
jgi:putative iron-dependent peroxidase